MNRRARSLAWWTLFAVSLIAVDLVAMRVLVLEAAERPVKFERDGHARFPFELRGQHVWVRGSLNGADSIWIVIDTGASSSVLDESVALRLGLELSGEHESMGAGGAQVGHTVRNVTIGLPGLSIHRKTLGAIDLGAVSRPGGRLMELVLGSELFQACVVRFDYEGRTLDVWEPAQAPRNPGGATVPMTLVDRHPYVEATLTIAGRPPLRGRYVIDTGSSAALFLSPEVTARESLTSAFATTLTLMARGVGGELENRIGRAESFALGTLSFKRPLVVMPAPGAGRISAPGTIGNIGGQVLGRCHVTFDYPRKRIHFEPNATFDRPFEADMLGAGLTRTSEGTIVRNVDPATPAAEVGLQVGDVVTHVDGEAVETIEPAALRIRMQQEGRVVRLRVKRGEEALEVTATLRRLI